MGLSAGTKLGPYDIQSPLGAGGMGEVYRAHDDRLGRNVAIKILPPDFATDPERVHRFDQEARAAAALNHPNLLAVYDLGTQSGSLYIVSELLEGETLRQRLQGGALPLRKVVEYGSQIARGLSAAHEKGIAHRDLKPENIFLTREGRIKILDFGLVKLYRAESAGAAMTSAPTMPSHTALGVAMGTVGYMSPEQVRGLPVDQRADIFALGAILFEMVSGKRAFTGATPADTMTAILKEDVPDLSETQRNVPPAVDRVVRHCLEKNQEERFQSASDVAFALEALSSVSGSTAAMAAAPVARPRRGVLIALAAVAVVAAFAVGLLMHNRVFGPPTLPRYRQITFRRGQMGNARFAPDGQTVIYGASWEGNPGDLYSGRIDSTGERALGMPHMVLLGISAAGEMAVRANSIFMGGYARQGILERVPLAGGAPRPMLDHIGDVGWAPNGNDLAITRYIEATRSWRLEYPIGKVLYETSGWIDAPRVSPKGDLVAFFDHPTADGDNRGTVAVVDLKGHKNTLTRTWSGETGLAWDPSGRELWFSASDTGLINSLWAASLSSRVRELARAPADLQLADVSRQGTALVRRGSAHFIIRALGPGQSQERELDWLDWSLPREISPDGKYVLFEEEGEGGGPEYMVYMRPTDGSPAVELGHGAAIAFSPDQQWVLTRPLAADPAPFILLPTGAGEPRQITHDHINHLDGTWFHNGNRILFEGNEPGHNIRDFILDVGSGQTRPVTPEGISGTLLMPDGKNVLVRDDTDNWVLWPLDGARRRRVAGLLVSDVPVQWSADGKALYLTTRDPADAFPKRRMYMFDLATGKRRLVGSYGVADLTGVRGFIPVLFSRDGKSYMYAYVQDQGELYTVSGLR
jgi:Tol biopolymer transport system component